MLNFYNRALTATRQQVIVNKDNLEEGVIMNGFQKKVIIRALDDPEHLSDWEYDFISDLADKDDDYELSDKQNKIINSISQRQ